MLLNIKKLMKRGHDLALKEWRHFDWFEGNSFYRFLRNQGSYNPRSLKKYSRIYEDYWMPFSRTKRFHIFNNIRTQFIRNVFYPDAKLDRMTPKEHFCGVEVLVVGCSGGILTESLAEMNFHVTGVDPNPFFMVIAKHHQSENKLLYGKKLNYVKATVEEFSKTNAEKFDAVIISNVLEFDIDYWHKRNFLKSCINCCKPGGSILITTMTFSLKTFYWSIIFDTEANWNAVNHKWYRGTNPDALRELLQSMNCGVKEERGIKFLPHELNFVPDVEINSWYFLHAKKKELQITAT